jgi:RNA polymerase primary sigma factor
VGRLANIEHIRGQLAIQNGREPTVEEIAKALGATTAETQSLRVVARHPVSLHEPLGGDGERALEDFLDDPAATHPGETVDQHLLRERIGEVLRSLTPREREVIEMRFGLKDGHPKTPKRSPRPTASPVSESARSRRAVCSSCGNRCAASGCGVRRGGIGG